MAGWEAADHHQDLPSLLDATDPWRWEMMSNFCSLPDLSAQPLFRLSNPPTAGWCSVTQRRALFSHAPLAGCFVLASFFRGFAALARLHRSHETRAISS